VFRHLLYDASFSHNNSVTDRNMDMYLGPCGFYLGHGVTDRNMDMYLGPCGFYLGHVKNL